MRLFRSAQALRALIGLRHSRAAGLTELATCLETGISSVQRALEILAADGLIEVESDGRRRDYSLREGNEAIGHLEALAELALDANDVLAIVARANPAVEFLAVGGDEIVVVFGKHGRARDQSRAAKAIGRIADRRGLRRRLLYHEDVRSRLQADPRLREQLVGARVLHGSLEASFPDRARHREQGGSPLGRVNPGLRLPSRRTLASLKRRHGVRRLRVFGSAVRSDFRPESDVDVAVELAAGTTGRLEARASIEEELERYLQRDVDVVLEESLRPAVRALVDREGVPL